MLSTETDLRAGGDAGTAALFRMLAGPADRWSGRTTAIDAELGAVLPGGAASACSDAGYEALLARCAGVPPVRTAVVHPCDEDLLSTAVAAAEAGLIEPVLIGPAAAICSVAARCRLDLRPYHLIGVEDDREAAETAVALARTARVEAIMQERRESDEPLGGVTAGGLPAAFPEVGVMPCGEVLVILTSPADAMRRRLASCALASLFAALRRGPPRAAV